jgi:hypothetical protein
VNYQIRVRGRLGRTMRAAFPALHAQTQGEDTLLTGTLADQAALHGVLAQIEALGLVLLEVRRESSERTLLARGGQSSGMGGSRPPSPPAPHPRKDF